MWGCEPTRMEGLQVEVWGVGGILVNIIMETTRMEGLQVKMWGDEGILVIITERNMK